MSNSVTVCWRSPYRLPKKEDHSRVEDEKFAFIKSFWGTSDYAECIPNGELGLAPDLRTYRSFNQLARFGIFQDSA